MQKLIFVRDDDPTYADLAMQQVESDIGLFATKYRFKRLDPEELAQELRIHIWNKLPLYDPTKASFRVWMWRVMRNKCLDMPKIRNYKLDTLLIIDDPDEGFLADRDEVGNLVLLGYGNSQDIYTEIDGREEA